MEAFLLSGREQSYIARELFTCLMFLLPCAEMLALLKGLAQSWEHKKGHHKCFGWICERSETIILSDEEQEKVYFFEKL